MSYTVYADGLCEPVNPMGVACFGYVIYLNGLKLAQGYGKIDHPSPSNNVAEYRAVIEALAWLIHNDKYDKPLTICSDSQLLIYQLNGYYQVKAPRLIPLFKEVCHLIKQFPKVKFKWVSREMNKEADALSRRAYEQHVKSNGSFYLKYKKYLATEKQKKLMKQLGISFQDYISKREASKLINREIQERGES